MDVLVVDDNDVNFIWDAIQKLQLIFHLLLRLANSIMRSSFNQKLKSHFPCFWTETY